MKCKASELIIKALKDESIKYSFGIPGTHNIELYDAFEDEPDLTPLLVCHEQGASFMADGLARVSESLAVVNVVPGAGLTHCLSGVGEAYMDQVPMLLLACGIRTDTGNAYQLHAINQADVVRPICKKVFEPKTQKEVYQQTREAICLAKKDPAGPVTVIIPANLYLIPDTINEADHLNFVNVEKENLVINTDQLLKITENLNASQNIALYV
ncbi:hypothetical protein BVY03_00265, partial [bacterium K02(2017)]